MTWVENLGSEGSTNWENHEVVLLYRDRGSAVLPAALKLSTAQIAGLFL
jgi:hypothetical protein